MHWNPKREKLINGIPIEMLRIGDLLIYGGHTEFNNGPMIGLVYRLDEASIYVKWADHPSYKVKGHTTNRLRYKPFQFAYHGYQRKGFLDKAFYQVTHRK